MYEITDEFIDKLRAKIFKRFSDFKGKLADFDELNTLNGSKELYKKLLDDAKKSYVAMAKLVYLSIWDSYKALKEDPEQRKIDDTWLDYILSDYDPVTKYVFFHEVERKEARFAESVVASSKKDAEIKTAMSLWSRMVVQYAIEITDEAVVDALKDLGYKYVIWRTEKDERRCVICASREGKRYPIKRIPVKPHINCRCWVEGAD